MFPAAGNIVNELPAIPLLGHHHGPIHPGTKHPRPALGDGNVGHESRIWVPMAAANWTAR